MYDGMETKCHVACKYLSWKKMRQNMKHAGSNNDGPSYCSKQMVFSMEADPLLPWVWPDEALGGGGAMAAGWKAFL